MVYGIHRKGRGGVNPLAAHDLLFHSVLLLSCCLGYRAPLTTEHGNDSVLYRAVESDSLIAVLRHVSCFAN